MAEKVEAFVHRLEPSTDVPVELWDESYSTVTAAERLRQRGKDARASKDLIDAEAAAVILEEWMRVNMPPEPLGGAGPSAGNGNGAA